MSVPQRFNFKRLDVYREAIDHFAWTVQVVARMPTAPFAIRNQVLGAALSVVANIAEGSGREKRPGEAEQHYRYALGSTYESAAFLDALAAMEVITGHERDTQETKLDRIAGMLSRLMSRHAARSLRDA